MNKKSKIKRTCEELDAKIEEMGVDWTYDQVSMPGGEFNMFEVPYVRRKLKKLEQQSGKENSDLVEKAKKLARGNPIIAIAIIVVAILVFIATAVKSWQTIFPPKKEKITSEEAGKKKRKHIKNKLKKLYGEISVLSDYPIPSGNLEALQNYEIRVNKWVSETSMWVEKNMGFGAREKFLNRSEGGYIWSSNYEKRFNKLMADLKRYKLGLEELIKSGEIWFETDIRK